MDIKQITGAHPGWQCCIAKVRNGELLSLCYKPIAAWALISVQEPNFPKGAIYTVPMVVDNPKYQVGLTVVEPEELVGILAPGEKLTSEMEQAFKKRRGMLND